MTNAPKKGEQNETDKSEEKPKLPEIIGGGANSYASKMIRQMAEQSPVTGIEIDPSALPKIEMPGFEGLEVTVPAFPPVSEEDVMSRFEMIYYDTCVERKVRENGEAIEMGDEVLIDLIGYIGGKIIPFNAHENLVLRLEPDSVQAGFGTALAGTPVGETKVIGLPAPFEGAPEGLKVAFVVDVKKAASLTFPKPDAPETLKEIGMGDTLDDVYGKIAAELAEERAGMQLSIGMGMALDAVAGRVEVELSKETIDTEIRTQWSKTEGRFLSEKGLSRQDLESALEGWLTDENTRKTAEQRLKIAMAIMSYALVDPEELTVEEIEGFFEEYSEEHGIDLVKWRSELDENPVEQANLLSQYLYMRTMTHLVSNIPITYEN